MSQWRHKTLDQDPASIFLAECRVYGTYSPPCLQNKHTKINHHSTVSSQNNGKPAPCPQPCNSPQLFCRHLKVMLRILSRLPRTHPGKRPRQLAAQAGLQEEQLGFQGCVCVCVCVCLISPACSVTTCTLCLARAMVPQADNEKAH